MIDDGHARKEEALPQPSSEYKVFCGGLSYQLTDATLKDAFAEFYPTDAKVMLDRVTSRSRGFGFVWFADEAAREAAIASIHDSEVEGRKISVSKAVPQSQTAPGTPADRLRRGETIPRDQRVGDRRSGDGRYRHGDGDRGGQRYGGDRGYDRGGYGGDRGYRAGGDRDRYHSSSGGGGYDRGGYGSYRPGYGYAAPVHGYDDRGAPPPSYAGYESYSYRDPYYGPPPERQAYGGPPPSYSDRGYGGGPYGADRHESRGGRSGGPYDRPRY